MSEAIDLMDYPAGAYADNPDPRINSIKAAIKLLPAAIDELFPEIAGVELEDPDAVYIKNIGEALCRRLRDSEARMGAQYKEKLDVEWSMHGNIDIIDRGFLLLAIVAEYDNAYRDVWFNFMLLMLQNYEKTKTDYEVEHPGHDYLEDLVVERRRENRLRMADLIEKSKKDNGGK